MIISGQRDCGKTTWCRESLSTETTAGVLLVKVYHENLCVGYDAVRLGAGDRIPFMRAGGTPDWDPPGLRSAGLRSAGLRSAGRIGRFSISSKGLSRAAEWIRESAGDPSKDVLVDEVGRLELEGRGFFSAVESAVELTGAGRARTLYLVVREIFVRDVMKRFGIEQAEVMEIEDGAVRSRGAVRS